VAPPPTSTEVGGAETQERKGKGEKGGQRLHCSASVSPGLRIGGKEKGDEGRGEEKRRTSPAFFLPLIDLDSARKKGKKEGGEEDRPAFLRFLSQILSFGPVGEKIRGCRGLSFSKREGWPPS